MEWRIFQKRPLKKADGEDLESADDLPEGDEMVTRRYEFYAYNGPVDPEDGEAKCENPDDCPGALGDYLGAQMAGFNAGADGGRGGLLPGGAAVSFPAGAAAGGSSGGLRISDDPLRPVVPPEQVQVPAV